MSKLKEKDIAIIEEYFTNGFNKAAAFGKFNDKSKYKTAHCFSQSVYRFFNKDDVKQYINELMNNTIGAREELINELLYTLKENVFIKPINEFYSYSDKQKDIQLLLKISGIDKAPKFKEEITDNTTIEVCIIDDLQE